MISKIQSFYGRLWAKFLGMSDVKKAGVVCLLGFIVIVLRRSELIFNAQFWAEDFAVFYQDAYNYGPASFFKAYSGMLQTFQRLVAFILMPVPLRFSPLMYNWVAIGIMLLPLFILWSDRNILKKEGPKAKAIISVLYLLLPNLAEIFGNLTNTLWFLSLAALLVLVRKTRNIKWLVFDIAILALAGLSGPLAPLLVVVGFFLMFMQRREKDNKWLWLKTGVLVVCSCVQLGVYAHAPAQRTASLFVQKRSIAVNYQKPVRIVGMRFYVVPVLGKDAITKDIAESPQVYALGLFTIALAIIGFLKSRNEVKAMLLFGGLVYGISLVRAQTVPVVQFWDMLLFNDFGERYIFIPFFVWIVLLVSLMFLFKNWLGRIATTIVVMYLLFFPFSFSVPHLKDFHFTQHAQAFEKLEVGQKHCFDLNPDDAWKTCLKKK